jgi:hypothetical protein
LPNKKFQLMDTIIGSLLRLVPGGSIGSLSDGTGQTAQGQIDALKEAQNDLQIIQKRIANSKSLSFLQEERNTQVAAIVRQLGTISGSVVD